ncbi:DUF1376 domain-containing protein [Psychrobacter arenosus]|uniref:DUF1376 domain-containing protein n=1 Tax=Psychrobacter arenosus TaxID=256326 RepID=UPI00191A4F5D|nr:DUF1376 domain-containing protein [Psychrobacter arenosus]
MHFVNHNFTDHDFETKHFNRIEKTIYLDLRSLYLSEEKPIDGSDMELLQRRLSVISDDEKQALAFVLKDKFTSSKAGKQYNQPAWDKIIKDYKYQQVTAALSDMTKRLRAAGVTIEANAGMSAIRELYIQRFGGDKLTRITNKANAMTNEANVKANRANNKANVMTNEGEYKLTSNDERRFMVDSLKGVGESVTLKTAISTLRALYAKRFNSDSKTDATNAIRQANDMTSTNANPMTNEVNIKANEFYAENDTITTNQEPVTKNQLNTLNNNSGEAVLFDVEVWQPALADIQPIVNTEAPAMPAMSQAEFDGHLNKFRNYRVEQVASGNPVATEARCLDMFVDWIKREYVYQQKAKVTTVNAATGKRTPPTDYSAIGKAPVTGDSDLPDVFHPSHSRPVTNANVDMRNSLVFNGVLRPALPGMTLDETDAYVKHEARLHGETTDITYDRLLNELQEAV